MCLILGGKPPFDKVAWVGGWCGRIGWFFDGWVVWFSWGVFVLEMGLDWEGRC